MSYLEKTISNNFYNKGAVISSLKNDKLLNLEVKNLIKIFERTGVILFKNFKILPADITKFTDKFTYRYANDATRREIKFNNQKIKSVDLGNMEMALHSEASFSPSWPEIVWFYCNKAPKKSGFTTLCDGIQIYKNLSTSTKKFFLKNQINYKLLIPFKQNINIEEIFKKKKLSKNIKEWLLETPGTFNTKINLKEGFVTTEFRRYAIVESRINGQLTFCNHLLAVFGTDPQIIKCTTSDGKKIPDEIYKEIKEVSKKITYQIKWKNGELCMVDNKRFMHGRSKILHSEDREIINVQTLFANFGFGATTRI